MSEEVNKVQLPKRFRLELVESTHHPMRTSTMDGMLMYDMMPEVGRPFNLVGAPLEDMAADSRLLTTSPVQKMETHASGKFVEFWTLNSHYILTELTDDGGTVH